MVEEHKPVERAVLDPRIAALMTNMMEYVMNAGTASVVRGRGFTAPAAGKTGTSHDAWFAGFTSNLLCIVWVGYDNYDDIHLAGAALAAPIWVEFMKRAVALPAYSDLHGFAPPAGVVQLSLDKATNELATPACPDDYWAAFIDGTQPTQTCEQGSPDQRTLIQRIFGLGSKPNNPPTVSNPPVNLAGTPEGVPAGSQPPAAVEDKSRKKGFFGRIFGGKGDSKENDKDKKPVEPGTGPGLR